MTQIFCKENKNNLENKMKEIQLINKKQKKKYS